MVPRSAKAASNFCSKFAAVMPRGGGAADLPELGCIGVVLLPLASCKAFYLALQAFGTALLFLHGALHSLQLVLSRQACLSGQTYLGQTAMTPLRWLC